MDAQNSSTTLIRSLTRVLFRDRLRALGWLIAIIVAPIYIAWTHMSHPHPLSEKEFARYALDDIPPKPAEKTQILASHDYLLYFTAYRVDGHQIEARSIAGFRFKTLADCKNMGVPSYIDTMDILQAKHGASSVMRLSDDQFVMDTDEGNALYVVSCAMPDRYMRPIYTNENREAKPLWSKVG